MSKRDGKRQIGLLGCGYIADWHAKAIAHVPGVSLAAVCDTDLARAHRLAARHGVARAYGSFEEMAERQRLDAVHVLLPPEHHYLATKRTVEAGLDVLLEKPMATRGDDCRELAGLAQGKGVKIGIGHNFLFSPVYERLKADLSSGRLGRPDHIVITWNRGLDQLRTGPFDAWMFREPENIMLEIAPHSVAHMLDLVGIPEIAEVRASNPMELPGGRRFYRRWRVIADKGPTCITLDFSFAPGFAEHSIRVRGSMASASADFERDTYTLHRHTKHDTDIDRCLMIQNEAADVRRQARRNLSRYVLAKFKLSDGGSAYGTSIIRALRSFYTEGDGLSDPRIAPTMGRDVVETCVEIGRRAGISRPSTVACERVAVDHATKPEILVLGASGFIGGELARQLVAKGHRIRVLVRNPSRLPNDLSSARVEVSRGDASNLSDFEHALEGIGCVYHLARANVKTWEEFLEHDILVTRRIAEACLDRGVKRLIYTGTIDSYYSGAGAGTITEQTPLDPQIARRNKYARAKAEAERILLEMHRERGLPVVIFRPGIVIGRGGSPFHWGVGMWSNNAICQLWGDGTHQLPFVLVEDVAAAMVSALDAQGIEGESFNLVSNAPLSALGYVHELERHVSVEFQKFPTHPWKFYAADMAKWLVKHVVRHSDRQQPSYRDWESRTHRARYDCTKARTVLGWTPTDDRDEFVRRGVHLPASKFLA